MGVLTGPGTANKTLDVFVGGVMRKGLVITAMLVAFPAFAGPHDFVIQSSAAGASTQTTSPYIAEFTKYAEGALKWPAGSVQGFFAENAEEAQKVIDEKKPAFGIMDPAVFLKLHKKDNLTPIASVVGKGQQATYHVVSTNPKIKDFKDLKGQKIVSTHVKDAEFINKIVFGGDVGATLEYTSRGSKVGQALSEGAASILDDDELAKAKAGGMKDLHDVGKAVKLPPNVVVAIGTPADKEALVKMLMGMCSDAKGGEVCKALNGITKFTPPDKAAYDEAVRRYEK
jgi:ABC-type phosphate/phosphonate transport system substrate-binding protein